jgi:hypothetical protein
MLVDVCVNRSILAGVARIETINKCGIGAFLLMRDASTSSHGASGVVNQFVWLKSPGYRVGMRGAHWTP